MYRLKVDFSGCNKGSNVEIANRTSSDKILLCDGVIIALESDLQTLITHGIIEKVQSPIWIDDDMIEFGFYIWNKNMDKPVDGEAIVTSFENYRRGKEQQKCLN